MLVAGCGRNQVGAQMGRKSQMFTADTKIKDVINDPDFSDYGRLIFPVDIRIDDDLTLQDTEEILLWYSEVNPERTVEIVNYMKDQVDSGNQIFYPIYSEEERKADPEKEDTGLFFFRGNAGEQAYPRPGAVIMQYTGLNDVTGQEPPTYACVGTRDGIASYRSMESYIRQIKADGTDAEIQVFDGLSHGFGLGEGTVAEGWIDEAVHFWKNQMK